MFSSYIFSPDIWPPLASILAAASIGLYAWRRTDVPAARYLAISFFLIVPWQLGVAMEAAAVSLQTRVAWRVFSSFFPLLVVTAAACFAFEYVRPGKWLTRRNLLLLWLPPLISIIFQLTNEFHLLFWRRVVVEGVVEPEYGLVGWILIGYVMALSLVQIGAFGWLFWRSPAHRLPAGLLITVVATTRLLWLYGVFNPRAAASLTSALLVTFVPTLAYAVALFGFRIFDPTPAARQTVIDQMLIGMVVFDARRRIVSLNPAAARMLEVESERLVGKTWQQSTAASILDLPLADMDAAAISPRAALAEITIARGPLPKQIAPALSMLYDFRGLQIGHLLVLHDVTEQRRAQAQIVDQQRALASLRERDLLARELHDSIGQVLGYASFQAEAVETSIANGQLTAARTQLERLAGVLREAHADVRQQILDLKVAPDAHLPFFDVIRNYLAAFSRNYDIPTALAIGDSLGKDDFPPALQSQLFRIMQEALSNARKHSGARHIQVAFAREDGTLRMTIRDDGSGINPHAARAEEGTHWGLRFMRERAEALSGELRIESSPGLGTLIVVELPEKVSVHARPAGG